MALARISVTVPGSLVAAADRRARELERSRSWVVAEALRRHLQSDYDVDRTASADQSAEPRRRAVREAAPHPYAEAEVAEARRRHLAAELALSPAARLHRAEELGRLALQSQGRGRRQQIIGFDSYEDYYQWKRARRIGG